MVRMHVYACMRMYYIDHRQLKPKDHASTCFTAYTSTGHIVLNSTYYGFKLVVMNHLD